MLYPLSYEGGPTRDFARVPFLAYVPRLTARFSRREALGVSRGNRPVSLSGRRSRAVPNTRVSWHKLSPISRDPAPTLDAQTSRTFLTRILSPLHGKTSAFDVGNSKFVVNCLHVDYGVIPPREIQN